MTYSYIEHVSDIGVHAEGDSLASAFESGVEAVLGVMFDLDTVGESVMVDIRANAADIDLLFVEVVNEALSLQCRDALALKRLKADAIEKTEAGFVFTGVAYGDRLDREKHGLKTEVKAATYSGLRYVRESNGKHIIECILDV